MVEHAHNHTQHTDSPVNTRRHRLLSLVDGQNQLLSKGANQYSICITAKLGNKNGGNHQ